MKNKAILLRSVSTIATAAASTALGVHGAQAQVVPAGTDGYYYSVTGGGFTLNKSEQFLTGLNDKVGYSGGQSGSGSSFSSYASGFSAISWSSFHESEYDGLDEFKGLFASVSFGKQITSNVDIRGSLSIAGASASGYGREASGYSSYQTYGYSAGGSSFSGWHDVEHGSYVRAVGTLTESLLAADFEVGYTPTLSNNFNVRMFAGLRALKFTQRFEGTIESQSFFESSYYDEVNSGSSWASGNYSGSAASNFVGVIDANFIGAGPRVGVQASTRFEGTNFGLSGSLATSVIFGTQTVTHSGISSYWSSWSSYDDTSTGAPVSAGDYISGSSSGSSSYSTNKTVLGLEASVGVDYYLQDNTVLTVGYQGQKLTEVGLDDDVDGLNIDSLTHGAFVKLSGSF